MRHINTFTVKAGQGSSTVAALVAGHLANKGDSPVDLSGPNGKDLMRILGVNSYHPHENLWISETPGWDEDSVCVVDCGPRERLLPNADTNVMVAHLNYLTLARMKDDDRWMRVPNLCVVVCEIPGGALTASDFTAIFNIAPDVIVHADQFIGIGRMVDAGLGLRRSSPLAKAIVNSLEVSV